ncbi:hypothetical protein COLO4_35869 [Corchorus olitorius]|uniref:Uncharacterized protein n=1 Tax=Corchorus olitorius TaxID=93759 RepID=A0A1R3GCK4_9ROSI|nr:hypothetical protein COLO4_35869 [Corchorus olitorius]
MEREKGESGWDQFVSVSREDEDSACIRRIVNWHKTV